MRQLILGICFAVSAFNLQAAEKWADSGLTVTDGLEVWLDASRQNEARKGQGNALINGAKLDAWLDASGHGRHVTQQDAERQPTFLLDLKRAAVRFDGKKQSLQASELNQKSRDVTVIVVTVPYANPGGFRAFAAANANGQNDFTSGWTLDMGPVQSEQFATVNPEGIGFQGALDLLNASDDFGWMQRLCVTSEVGKGATKLYVNNQLQGQRDRAESQIQMDQLTVGARHYNFGAPPQVTGFLDGEISELLIYSRVLSESERKTIDEYLVKKHGDKTRVNLPPSRTVGKKLVRVANPPPVQMFVPGFAARKLPLDLPNINNIRYRLDGKVVALGYNGNVYLLTDRDRDGLEDDAQLFFESNGRVRSPIGMALTPPGYAHGQGLFVASKGKCSLIVDKDGDDKADEEIVIASGWKELFHGVDALGVAVDPRDHSVYFGLGTENFTNAYVVNDGKAGYKLDGERGTIMRVSPDFKSREIICTGIRFPVGLAFNALGDLFCSDQEGATWLPNGNPFDELLHIEKGRHYGFPPRHPQYLPKVIDEPSVFDYRPQHQSTCGLQFNDFGNGVSFFGPRWWRGDALVCGYSRGKLYRTALHKTAHGYVAQNQLIGSVNGLLVDATVSMAGDLLVATHSGSPDWGSGPQGQGTLYKIDLIDKDVPQPVRIWSQGPYEVRVVFDRPLKIGSLNFTFQQSAKEATNVTAAIEYGPAAGAGDRYEALRPGYQVVQDQLVSPRNALPVHSVQLMPDGRTLTMNTGLMEQAVPYAVTMAGFMDPAKWDKALPQESKIDLQYDLCGVEARWHPSNEGPFVAGWLPHFDSEIAESLDTRAGKMDPLWNSILKPGKLTMRSQLHLQDMLRPAVQPGARIDYRWPEEIVEVHFHAHRNFQLRTSSSNAKIVTQSAENDFHSVLTVKASERSLTDIELTIETNSEPSGLKVWWNTNEDSRPRVLPLNRLLLPWAKLDDQSKPSSKRKEIPQLAGGNWSRGRQVFLDKEVGCAKCHNFQGEGEAIGPALSNLPLRDYESVMRDITQPSAAFNPDYLPYSIQTIDGRVFAGTVRSEGEFLLVGATNATVTKIARDDIETMTPASVSIMPEGIAKTLGDERLKDVLTFLLTPPPSMPEYGALEPPSPRTQAEVDAVLAGAQAVADPRPLQVVLVAGRKDHGPGEHDYPAWLKMWGELMSMADKVEVGTAMEWPTPDQLISAHVLVFYQQGRWTPERARDLDAFLARGGGAVYLHYAVDGGMDAAGFAERIGLAWKGGQSAFRHGELDLVFPSSNHPIARNFDKVHFHDESYWRLTGDPSRIQVLATGIEESRPQPLFWTMAPGNGRVFVSILGHFSWTFDDPLFRTLILRGIAWSANEPVDRFQRLVPLGARIQK